MESRLNYYYYSLTLTVGLNSMSLLLWKTPVIFTSSQWSPFVKFGIFPFHALHSLALGEFYKLWFRELVKMQEAWTMKESNGISHLKVCVLNSDDKWNGYRLLWQISGLSIPSNCFCFRQIRFGCCVRRLQRHWFDWKIANFHNSSENGRTNFSLPNLPTATVRTTLSIAVPTFRPV